MDTEQARPTLLLWCNQKSQCMTVLDMRGHEPERLPHTHPDSSSSGLLPLQKIRIWVFLLSTLRHRFGNMAARIAYLFMCSLFFAMGEQDVLSADSFVGIPPINPSSPTVSISHVIALGWTCSVHRTYISSIFTENT